VNIWVRPANFRDVGEILGLWLDGSPIPSQRLFRGGCFDTLTNAADLGNPRTILNLRRGPDPDTIANARIIHVPALDDIENYDTRHRRVQEWLAHCLAVLSSGETAWPVYVHCTSGRVRTGVVIAAALVLAGISPDVAVAEYMLSDGAQVELIEPAIDGVLAAASALAPNVSQLRAALCGAG
jgi:protein-tyrosine phosphatase